LQLYLSTEYLKKTFTFYFFFMNFFKKLGTVLIGTFALLLGACEDKSDLNPQSQVEKASATNKNSNGENMRDNIVFDNWCPWCDGFPAYVGQTPPFPPVGQASPPATAPAGQPTSAWKIEDYEKVEKFKVFITGLNSVERAYFALRPHLIPGAQGNKWNAESKANQLYFEGNRDNVNANAFKHAYWCKLNQLSFGVNVAREIAENHEAVFTDLVARTMDRHNNEIGLTTPGTLHGFPPPRMPENLYFTASILKYIAQGYGRRIDNGDSKTGNLVKTDGTGRR
jgi:hypothetical protein